MQSIPDINEQDEALIAQQQVVRLQALLEASRQIHSTIALDKVLDTALQIVVRELELSGAFFTGFPNRYGDVPHDLPEAVVSTQNPAASAHSTPPASQQSSSCWVKFPLHDKVGSAFTELVVISPQHRILSLDELDFIESLVLQASVAIENARFHERTVQWQRVESDLDSARQVQRSLLPQDMPLISGYSMAMRSVTCYEVGGDYLDVVPMASGATTIVVADVAGKGLASALVGCSFRSAFRAMVNAGLSLLEIANRMNSLHFGEGEQSRRRYVTAFFLHLDPERHVIEVVNAGHNPGFLLSAPQEDPSGRSEPGIRKIGASGTPIGMLPFSSYSLATFPMPPGARLLLYTDGMTEVFRSGHGVAPDEEFGEDRLLHTFLECPSGATPEQILDTIWSALEGFGDQDQSDDMTALVLNRACSVDEFDPSFSAQRTQTEDGLG
ncbi:MAG: PP2C family protein-serine/threonine phosphatase [Acidobacteriaceae bacterium]